APSDLFRLPGLPAGRLAWHARWSDNSRRSPKLLRRQYSEQGKIFLEIRIPAPRTPPPPAAIAIHNERCNKRMATIPDGRLAHYPRRCRAHKRQVAPTKLPNSCSGERNKATPAAR